MVWVMVDGTVCSSFRFIDCTEGGGRERKKSKKRNRQKKKSRRNE